MSKSTPVVSTASSSSHVIRARLLNEIPPIEAALRRLRHANVTFSNTPTVAGGGASSPTSHYDPHPDSESGKNGGRGKRVDREIARLLTLLGALREASFARAAPSPAPAHERSGTPLATKATTVSFDSFVRKGNDPSNAARATAATPQVSAAASAHDDHQDDALASLGPILAVIRSSLVGTDAKAVAVEALSNLIKVVDFHQQGAKEAVHAAAEAVIECRFEQTDSSSDEIAILCLLEGLAACAKSPSGAWLSDEAYFRVVETMFDACVAPFNSPTIRTVATRLAAEIVSAKSVFNFRPETHAPQLTAHPEDPVYPSVAQSLSLPYRPLARNDAAAQKPHGAACARSIVEFLVEMAEPNKPAPSPNSRSVALRLLFECLAANDAEMAADPVIFSIIKDDLCRVVIQTCQTFCHKREAPSVVKAGYQDPPNPNASRATLLSEGLRIARVLFGRRSLRRSLKLQFEAFFQAVFARAVVGSSSTSPIAMREDSVLVLDALCDVFASDARTWYDVFQDYDCDLKRSNLFEATFALFSRLAVTNQGSSSHLNDFQLLGLRGLISGLRALSSSSQLQTNSGSPAASGEYDDYLATAKRKKATALKCADIFNRSKPKQALEALLLAVKQRRSESVAASEEELRDAQAVALFLRTHHAALDRVQVGLFLGEAAAFNGLVRVAFCATFERAFSRLSVLDALRVFLESFRLPKEAQQIDRVVQAFADVAFQHCTDASLFPTVDVCYVFSFAVIILNTDLHNPVIKPEARMSVEDFVKRNTNYGPEFNKGRDLSREFLTGVYREIQSMEINTLKDGQSEISRHRWIDLMTFFAHQDEVSDRSRQKQLEGSTTTLCDGLMFGLISAPALAAISVVFNAVDPADQPEALHAALDGFILIAKAANKLDNSNALDQVIASLCKFTSLLAYGNTTAGSSGAASSGRGLAVNNKGGNQGKKGSSRPSVLGDPLANSDLGRGTRLSDAVSAFANNHKGHIAARTVFALARRYGSCIRVSWRHIVRAVLRLNDLHLLPDDVIVDEPNVWPSELESARKSFHVSIKRGIELAAIKRGVRLAVDPNDAEAKAALAVAQATHALNASSSGSRKSSSSAWGITSWLFGSSASSPQRMTREEEDDENDEDEFYDHEDVDGEDQAASVMSAEVATRRALESDRCALLAAGRVAGRVVNLAPPTSDDPEDKDYLDSFLSSRSSLVRFARDAVRSCRVRASVLHESRELELDALIALVDACVDAVNGSRAERAPSDTAARRIDDGEASLLGLDWLSAPTPGGGRAVSLRLLTGLACAQFYDEERFLAVWSRVSRCFIDLIVSGAEDAVDFVMELAGLGFLTVFVGYFHKLDLTKSAASTAILSNLLVSCGYFIQSTREAIGKQEPLRYIDGLIGKAVDFSVRKCVLFDNASTRKTFDAELSSEVVALLDACAAGGYVMAGPAMDALNFLVRTSHRKRLPVRDVSRTACAFVQVNWSGASNARDRETMGVDLLFALHERVSSVKPFEEKDVEDVWFPLLRDIARVAQDANEISSRRRALHALLRCLLDDHGPAKESLTGAQWIECYETIIFPVAQAACGETRSSSPEELKLRLKLIGAAADLICKALLSRASVMVVRVPPNKFDELWLETLQFIERFKREADANGTSDLGVTIMELLKSVLIGLASCGILALPPNVAQAMLVPSTYLTHAHPPGGEDSSFVMVADAERQWTLTWNFLSRSTELYAGLFPEGVAIESSFSEITEPEKEDSSSTAQEPGAAAAAAAAAAPVPSAEVVTQADEAQGEENAELDAQAAAIHDEVPAGSREENDGENADDEADH